MLNFVPRKLCNLVCFDSCISTMAVFFLCNLVDMYGLIGHLVLQRCFQCSSSSHLYASELDSSTCLYVMFLIYVLKKPISNEVYTYLTISVE